MSIIFSRQCEYALQAVMYLALKPMGKMTSIRELTNKLEIPFHFVGKILQDLTHRGLLVSHKGPSGGFTLKKAAKDITLYDIIEAIDGNGFRENCVLGFPSCSPAHPCALHDKWSKARDGIYSLLVGKTIEEMADAMKKPQYPGVVKN